IMLQYHTSEWNNRAVWGEIDAIPFGTAGTTEKLRIGPLPEPGKWVRLEGTAAKLGLQAGTRITGMAFTMFDGTAYWDKVGQIAVQDPAENPELSLRAWEKAEKELGDNSVAPQEIKDLLKKPPAKRNKEE